MSPVTEAMLQSVYDQFPFDGGDGFPDQRLSRLTGIVSVCLCGIAR